MCQWHDTLGSPKPRISSFSATTGLESSKRWPGIVNHVRSARRASLGDQLQQRWWQCFSVNLPQRVNGQRGPFAMYKEGQLVHTFCNYATWHPKAVALPSVEPPHVVKKLIFEVRDSQTDTDRSRHKFHVSHP